MPKFDSTEKLGLRLAKSGLGRLGLLLPVTNNRLLSLKCLPYFQNAGGSVMIQRVNGSLAVSRALGDFEYKNVDGKGPTEQGSMP